MKKLFITLGVIAVLIFGGYLYLNRPLPYEIENISESRFDLPKRKNPSALSKLEAIFTDDNETLKRLLDREENRHDDLSGSLLNEANREKVMQKITPDFRRDLATIQDQMRPLLSGYDFYIKSGTTLIEAMPQLVGMQFVARTTTTVAVLDCLQDQKKCDQSFQDIAMVMHFGRKMQTGGSTLYVLIGNVMESHALEKAIYLERNNISTKPIREYFSKMTFPSADDVRKNTIRQEYHLFKNELKRVNKISLTKSGPLGTLLEDQAVSMMAGSNNDGLLFYLTAKIFPKSRTRDEKRTQKVGKNLYDMALRGRYDEVQEMLDALDTIRENMLGYRLILAAMPQFEGIERRINSLYSYNSYIPLTTSE